MNGIKVLERAKEWAHLGAAEAISRAGAGRGARHVIEALTLFKAANDPHELADYSCDGLSMKRCDPAPVRAALDRAIARGAG